MNLKIQIIFLLLLTSVSSQSPKVNEELSLNDAKKLALSYVGIKKIDKFIDTNIVIKNKHFDKSSSTLFQKAQITNSSFWSIEINNVPFNIGLEVEKTIDLTVYLDTKNGNLFGGHSKTNLIESKIIDLQQVSTEFKPFNESFSLAKDTSTNININDILVKTKYFNISKEFSFLKVNYSSNFIKNTDVWIVYLEGIPPLSSSEIADSISNKISNYRIIINAEDGNVIHSMQFVNKNFR